MNAPIPCAMDTVYYVVDLIKYVPQVFVLPF